MKRLSVLTVIVVSFALLLSCAKKGEQKSVTGYVAKVGSVAITQDDVDREMKALPEQIQKMFAGPEGMERFVDELVKKEILYQEAKKEGFESNPEYKKKVEDFKRISLISLLLEKEIEAKAKVSDADLKKYYEDHKAELTAGGQLRASHILVKTEAEANKILGQLKKGGDFASIAKEESIDKNSAVRGGDLGFFSRGQMVPAFENAAMRLKVGEIGGPVETQFGYHIIKLTGRKEGRPVEFDKIKDLLRQRVTAEKQKELFDSYVERLKKSYSVEKNKDAIAKLAGAEQEKSEARSGDESQAGGATPSRDVK
jgi:peptidyl-prolyl cis-trans isomerase C